MAVTTDDAGEGGLFSQPVSSPLLPRPPPLEPPQIAPACLASLPPSSSFCHPPTPSSALPSETYAFGHVPIPPSLAALTEEFREEVFEGPPGVFVFSGFGLANSVFINTTEGVIVIDTMESTATMANVWNRWLKINNHTNEETAPATAGTTGTTPAEGTTEATAAATAAATATPEATAAATPAATPATTPEGIAAEGIATTTSPAATPSPATTPSPGTTPAEAIAAAAGTTSPATSTCTDSSDEYAARRKLAAAASPPYTRVLAIILSHFHSDHVFGASVILQPQTAVYIHRLTLQEMYKTFTLLGGVQYKRAMRQFGVFVSAADFANSGIGPWLMYDSEGGIGTVAPTHILEDERENIQIGDVQLEVIHAPGESKDQLIIWWPSRRVLFGADNLYKSFPNIYAIRGTETRDCHMWIRSLTVMQDLKPDILLLGHAKPIHGNSRISSTIEAYRDAIQFVHDQTIRYMNKGYQLNDIVHLIRLPPRLRQHPYLQEHYGTVAWSVRAIFTQYVGWFSGNAEDLHPLSTMEKAEALDRLAGGHDELVDAIQQNLLAHNTQWSLELSTACHRVYPESLDCLHLNLLALRTMAAGESAATGRNWYLTAALEVEQSLSLRLSDTQKRQALSQYRTMQQLFEFLPYRLDAENALDLDYRIVYEFDDTGERLCAVYRNAIAYTTWPCDRKPDVTVATTSDVFRSILMKDTTPLAAVARGDIRVSGSVMVLITCLSRVEMDLD
eukprot:GHVS01034879.1.p1 GENE.GHVS01034879.1~~GHVS01034879.1.p1  ORF type:complete len:774 (+),score=167.94 GHVS01034879.1:123-2324(+)